MPCPVSLTRASTLEPARCRSTSTRPPRGVNLIAFESRFQITCCNRSASPRTRPAAGSMSRASVIAFASAAAVSESVAASTTGPSSRERQSSCSLPVTMRETSSRSSTRRAWARAFRSTASMARAAASGSRAFRRNIQSQEIIALSGVRSSCESVERNSSFKRFASRASPKSVFSIAIEVICASCTRRSSSSGVKPQLASPKTSTRPMFRPSRPVSGAPRTSYVRSLPSPFPSSPGPVRSGRSDRLVRYARFVPDTTEEAGASPSSTPGITEAAETAR